MASTNTSNKTRRLKNVVSGELHAHASRRKDRKLLDDITSKLYDVDNDLIKPSERVTSAVSDLRRLVSSRDRGDLITGKQRTTGSHYKGFRTNNHSLPKVTRSVSEPHAIPSFTRTKGLPPTAELAVRTARRCLSRLETELGRDHNDETEFDLTPRISNLKQHHLPHRPVKLSPMPVPNYLDDFDSDYYVPPVRGRSVTRPKPLVTGIGGATIATGTSRHTIRHRSLTPSKPVNVQARRQLSVEEDYEFLTPSYSNLRAKYTEAKNKLDMHKTLLDKYLPLYLGPENDVEIEVDYKFGELVARMPRLDPYRPPMNNNYSISTISKPPRGRPINSFEVKVHQLAIENDSVEKSYVN